jgi:hypothetical protein
VLIQRRLQPFPHEHLVQFLAVVIRNVLLAPHEAKQRTPIAIARNLDQILRIVAIQPRTGRQHDAISTTDLPFRRRQNET